MPATSTDYSDRTFSLSITDTVSPQNRIVRPGFSTNRSVTGVQKLIERYIVLLFEVAGSSVYARSEGTDLVSDLLNGSVVSKGQIRHILNFANSQVLRQLQESETIDDPPDERVKSTQLTVTGLTGDVLSFLISIETQAGTSLQFTMPTTVAIP